MSKPFYKRLSDFWRVLGPGLVTGAADDDPSGIVTYAVAGAKMGLAALWTVIVTIPFMVITQRMAGRIGLISGRGLAGNMKKYYPRWLLIGIALLILGANIINIGADISAMSASITLLSPRINPIFFSAAIPLIITLFLVLFPYKVMVNYLKWAAVIMFSYVIAAFFVHLDWQQIIYRTFVPGIVRSKDYLLVVVAVFGTTISPYLFFWQASGAVEEEKARSAMVPADEPHAKHRSNRIIKNEISDMYLDVKAGMVFSNLISYFIIVLCAFTLFKTGTTDLNTVDQVAAALKPMAGKYSNFLFLIGILVSGALAIPVLAGSAAYALAEMLNWRWGFDNSFHRAKQFYVVIIISTLLGIAIPALGFQPVNILFYTAVIFGFISPVMILLLIHMANNPKIMGKYISRAHSNVIAYTLFLIMTASIIALLAI